MFSRTMYTRLSAFVLLLALLAALSGCRDQTIVVPHTDGDDLTALPFYTADGYPPETLPALTPSSIAETKDGVFFTCPGPTFDFSSILYFYDNAAAQIAPVCGKPDCTHDAASPDCNANVSDLSAWSGMRQQGDWLYVTGMGTGEYAKQYCLWCLATDGTGREIVMPLGKPADDGSCLFGNWILEDETLYYARYTNRSEITLYAKSFSGETKALYTCQGAECQMLRLCRVGNGLYFEEFYYTNEDYSAFTGRLAFYNLDDHTVTTAIDGCFKPYAIGFDRIYYMNKTELLSFIPATGETRTLCTTDGFGDLAFDGTYLFCTPTGQNRTLVLSAEGEILADIPLATETKMHGTITFANGRILSLAETKRNYYLGMLSTADAAAGQTDWTDILLPALEKE